MIVPTAAQVLYRYDDPFYRTYAAITVNDFGQGAAFYLGTTPDRAVLTQVLTMAVERAGLNHETAPRGAWRPWCAEGRTEPSAWLSTTTPTPPRPSAWRSSLLRWQ